jgi:hypothetical protein
VEPLSARVAITGASIGNPASFTGGIAPGGIVSFFGAGLVRAGVPTAVQINASLRSS